MCDPLEGRRVWDDLGKAKSEGEVVEEEEEDDEETLAKQRDIEKSTEFWLALAEERMAVMREEKAEAGATSGAERKEGAERVMSAVIENMLPPFFPAGSTYSEEEAKELVRQARSRLGDTFEQIDMQTQRTLAKVLKAFRKARVGPHLFGGTDGYGHGDLGRETLDDIYAELFGAEQALVNTKH
jgi:hypothetical protein